MIGESRQLSGMNSRFVASEKAWLLLTLFIGGVLLHRGLYYPGALVWGDWLYMSETTQRDLPILPSTWQPMYNLGFANGQINIAPVYSLLGMLGHIGIGPAMAQRLVIFWPMSFLPFASMFLFCSRLKLKPWASAGGAMVFGANSYMMTRGIQHPFVVLGASAMPLLWAAVADLVATTSASKNKTKHGQRNESLRGVFRGAALIGLSASLIVLFDFRMTLLAFAPVVVMLTLSCWKDLHATIRIAGTMFLAGALALLIHSYWIIPTVFGGGSGGLSGLLPQTPFQNFFTLAHSLALSDPFYNGGKPVWFSTSDVMVPLFALPVLASIGVLVARNRRVPQFVVVSFVVTAAAAVFLTKGQNHPLGDVYNFMFTNIPGMRFFRDAAKFAALTAGSYAILIALALDRVTNWWSNKEDDTHTSVSAPLQMRLFYSKRDRLAEFWKNRELQLVAVLVVITFAVPTAWGARASITNQLGGASQPVRITSYANQLEQTLNNDSEFGRVLWLPNPALLSIVSNKHPAVFPASLIQAADALAPNDQPKNRLQDSSALMPQLVKFPRLVDLLESTATRYIVLDANLDSDNWFYSDIARSLRQQFFDDSVKRLSANPSFEKHNFQSGFAVFKLKDPVSVVYATPSDQLNANSVSSGVVATDINESSTRISFTADKSVNSLGKKFVVHLAVGESEGWVPRFKAHLSDGTASNPRVTRVKSSNGLNAWALESDSAVKDLSGTIAYEPQKSMVLAVVISIVSFFLAIAILIISGWPSIDRVLVRRS